MLARILVAGFSGINAQYTSVAYVAVVGIIVAASLYAFSKANT